MTFNQDLQLLNSIKEHFKKLKLEPTERYSNYIKVQYEGKMFRITVVEEGNWG